MKTALTACLAAAVLASGAAAEPAVDAAKKCPRGKARVTVAGKSSCLPLASVLPKRRAGNGLAPVLSQGLDPTWGETRDGPRTLTQLVGPDKKRVIDDAVGRALARLKSAGSGSGRFAAAVRAAANCKYSGVLPVTSDSYKADLGGGGAMEATMRTGPDGASMSLSMTAPLPGGRSVRISVDLGMCNGERLEVDSCPTSQGVVQGTDNTDGTISVEQFEDGALVESQSTKVHVATKLRGEVGDDAKLKTLDIERTESYDTSLDYGRWLGVGQKISIRRTATIWMPSGQYSSGTGSVDVQQSFRGLLSFLVNESAARTAVLAQAQKTSADSWSKFVDEAIKKYREREKGWQEPVCAELEFAPKSNTLRVRLGQQGLFTGTVKAKRGGAAEGRWRVTARNKLGVRMAGNHPAASLPWRFRVDGEGKVSVTFRVTSKAGVASGTWEQGGSTLPHRISGSFSGRSGTNTVSISWTGTITFVRDDTYSGRGRAGYAIERVAYTSTYSINEAGCRGQGTGSASLGKQGAGSYLLLQRRHSNGKHEYEMNGSFQGPASASISVTCHGYTTTMQWPPSALLLTYPKTFTVDSRNWTFSGTHHLPATLDVTWNLRGSTR